MTLPQGTPTQHAFEDADTGDELVLEAGVTYTVTTTFAEVGSDLVDGQLRGFLVFTHRVRETVAP